jgi:outer membrane protein OmpA-like peptidoglycan-associated protein
MMKRYIILLICAFISIASFSQDDYLNSEDYVAKFEIATDYMDDGNFHASIQILDSLNKQHPDNFNISFKMGYCLLNTAMRKIEAIEYLEHAVKGAKDDYNPYFASETGAPYETWFYLGKAYHVNYQFDQAINVFNQLKGLIVKEDDERFFAQIEREIETCENAKELVKTPINMVVTNLGEQVNSPYAEHSPVVSGDETILIFTSKRKENVGNRQMDDGQYFEDIYASYKINGDWIEAVNISDNINTSGHEASIGLSVDGRTLFIYRDDNGDGNIYISQQDGLDWTVPEKLGSQINTSSRETHASLSADGEQLYFTSDRKGGFGGLDIYVVKKLPNGQWGKPQNLGPTINTPYDEEGPFIHYDGITLFFSSAGHKSMGGLDIYSSTMQEDLSWGEPVNIGYPINTPDNDVFYWVTPDGRRAYYASHQSGSFGNTDIFIINLPESHVRNMTVLTGLAANVKGEVLTGAEISVFDKETGDLVGVYKPDQETGRYLIILPKGKEYDISIMADGYEEVFNNLSIPDEPFEESQEVVKIETVEMPVMAKEYMINETIFFDFDKAETNKIQTETYYEVLNIIIEYFKNNPDAKIEIGGHCDSKGPEVYNQYLSEERAKFVKQYLVENKIPEENLFIKGYGENNPIALNSYSDGRDCREGRKFNRRVEFKVLSNGNDKLIFKKVGVPDELTIK